MTTLHLMSTVANPCSILSCKGSVPQEYIIATINAAVRDGNGDHLSSILNQHDMQVCCKPHYNC